MSYTNIRRMTALAVIFACMSAFTTDRPAYRLFDAKGKPVKYEKMAKALAEADVVLFGEMHNNPICHWMQLQVTKSLHETHGEKLALAAEMFEADDQLVLDEYMADLIKESHLKSEAKVWPNYDTDYRPLVEFAKANGLTFVASNVPRRYASVVAFNGLKKLEDLPEAAKAHIAPLPIEVDMEMGAYADMAGMMGGAHGAASDNFIHAQAIKDATMAHFVLQEQSEGKVVLHFNGDYHSKNFESIVWYLQQSKPDLNVMTISSVEQESVEKLDEKYQAGDKLPKGAADFILAIPADMTKTY